MPYNNLLQLWSFRSWNHSWCDSSLTALVQLDYFIGGSCESYDAVLALRAENEVISFRFSLLNVALQFKYFPFDLKTFC